MPHAVFTPAEPADPARSLPPAVAAKPRGNLYFRLASAQPARGFDPRGARTRTCRSPAIHGKLRHRMHGVRSPGLRTPESLPRRRPGDRIRVRDARTIHRNHGAKAHADNCLRLTLLRISRVDIALDRYQAHLPTAPSANSSPQGAPMPSPTARFKPSRIDPLNREPMAKPGSTAPFKPFRTDPLNREPTAKSATTPSKPSRIDLLNPLPPSRRPSTATRAAATEPSAIGGRKQRQGAALKPASGLCPPGPPTKGGGLWNPFIWLR